MDAALCEPSRERIAWGRLTFVAAMHGGAAYALLHPTLAGLAAFAASHFLAGCLGVSLGYHRLLAHRAFAAPPAVGAALAALGSLAMQGPPLQWVALHRAHHRWTDGPRDPHSAARGPFWSHVGWVLVDAPNGFTLARGYRMTRDLLALGWLRRVDRAYLPLNAAVVALVTLLLGWKVALWAFPLRVVVSWHSAWMVNSVAHGAGREPPSPRNVGWVAALTYGEGLHENHHARPSSPSFGRGDVGALVLRGLVAARLATTDRRPRS